MVLYLHHILTIDNITNLTIGIPSLHSTITSSSSSVGGGSALMTAYSSVWILKKIEKQ